MDDIQDAHNQFMQFRDFSGETESKILRRFLHNKTEGTYILAWYLIRKFNIRNGDFDMPKIKSEIQRILGIHTTSKAKSETISKIKDMNV